MLAGLMLTDGQVGDLFARNLATAEGIVRRYVRVQLTQGQFDALADFAFNIGADQFRKSTLVRLLNIPDYQGAFNELPKWRYDNGVVLSQLVERRAAGQQLFIA
jgi:lysozyme